MAGALQKRAYMYVRVIQAYDYFDKDRKKHYKHAIGDEFELVGPYSDNWLMLSVDNGLNHSYIPRDRVELFSKPIGAVIPTSRSSTVFSKADSTESSAGINTRMYSESEWREIQKTINFMHQKQSVPPSLSSFSESFYEDAKSTLGDDDNLYSHLQIEEEHKKINIQETNGLHKRNTVALNQKIRDQGAEIKEKNAQLRKLKESRKRWQIKAGRQPTEPGKDSVSSTFSNAWSDDGEYLHIIDTASRLPDRPKEIVFEFPEKLAPMRSAKFESKKIVHLGVFLEYRKVHRTNAIFIHVVLCSDQELMKSTNDTKLHASKPLLIYVDLDDPVIHVTSLQWDKTNNENQEEVKVVSIDILLAGLPWEIKFTREFRSKLFGTGVPDTLKFDVCVVQPRIPETTLNVWCAMKELTSSVESKSHKNADVRNSVSPNGSFDRQKPNRKTLFGVREVDDVPRLSEISLTQVEMRNHAPSEAAGQRRQAVPVLDPKQDVEDSRLTRSGRHFVLSARAPSPTTSPPPPSPTTPPSVQPFTTSPPPPSPTTPPSVQPLTTAPRASSPTPSLATIYPPGLSPTTTFPRGRKDHNYENVTALPQRKH